MREEHMLGILFNTSKLNRLLQGKEPYEHINFYLRFAAAHHLDLFFYSPDCIKGKSIRGFKVAAGEQKWQKCACSIPKVNIVRTILSMRKYHKLRKLERQKEVAFLNLVPCRDKYVIYNYLSRRKTVSDAIPKTEKLTFKTLLSFLDQYSKVVIKPRNGSLGWYVFTIEKINKGRYEIRSTYRGQQKRSVIPASRLRSRYNKGKMKDIAYIIQPYLTFRQYQGGKFDLRTSVQKDHHGNWRVTGIVARVAAKNGIVTNVAQGGRVVSYKDIQLTLPGSIKQELYKLSLQIAKELELLYPSTADLGLDLAIDEQNKLWFIEANYFDQRYAYRESNDLEMWEAAYFTPMEYAYALLTRLAAQNGGGTEEKSKTILNGAEVVDGRVVHARAVDEKTV